MAADANGGHATLNQLDVTYWAARADARAMLPMRRRRWYRRLIRRRARLDWVGLATLKGVREELVARGEEVSGWTT